MSRLGKFLDKVSDGVLFPILAAIFVVVSTVAFFAIAAIVSLVTGQTLNHSLQVVLDITVVLILIGWFVAICYGLTH